MADVAQGLPGFETTELPEQPELAGTEDWTTGQWAFDFESTLARLELFLRIRDPYVVLARTASSFTIRGAAIERPDDIKQTQVEITQTLLLLTGPRASSNPTSPGSFERYWSLLSRHHPSPSLFQES